MKSSDDCLTLIKSFEGFRAEPYLCPAGKPTLGFGSCFYEDGTPVTLDDDPITEEDALELLKATLVKYEDGVNRLVKVELTQGQFDCLTDFCYNAGINALANSTLLKLLNDGNYESAGLELAKWVRGGGKVLPGLVKRRNAEYKLWAT